MRNDPVFPVRKRMWARRILAALLTAFLLLAWCPAAALAEEDSVLPETTPKPWSQEDIVPSVEKLPESAFTLNAKSAVLMDYATGMVLYSYNGDEKLPMASVTKMMTLLLTFEALEDGQFTLDQMVPVSETASGMGGSQVFLYPGEQIPLSELLKCVIVASANDACVTLAELVSGSHEAFVQRMNERAEELGMTNTHFSNSTGLPAENHYSTAHDMGLLACELFAHQEYYTWSAIWLERVSALRNNTEIANTNRLVRTYSGCDGGKTGSSKESGYCYAGTAQRDGLRLVAVVLGAESSDLRFADVRAMWDYGFSQYESVSVVRQSQPVAEARNIPVAGGQEKIVCGIAANALPLLLEKGAAKQLEQRVELLPDLQAPIAQGDPVGTLSVWRGEELLGYVPLVADRDVQKAGFWHYFSRIFARWTGAMD